MEYFKKLINILNRNNKNEKEKISEKDRNDKMVMNFIEIEDYDIVLNLAKNGVLNKEHISKLAIKYLKNISYLNGKEKQIKLINILDIILLKNNKLMNEIENDFNMFLNYVHKDDSRTVINLSKESLFIILTLNHMKYGFKNKKIDMRDDDLLYMRKKIEPLTRYGGNSVFMHNYNEELNEDEKFFFNIKPNYIFLKEDYSVELFKLRFKIHDIEYNLRKEMIAKKISKELFNMMDSGIQEAQNIVINQLNESNNFTKEQIDKINKIKSEYDKIKEHNLENQDFFDKLIGKKMPEIIGRFLSVPIEYRKEFKNSNGLTAENIFNNCLNEIDEIFTKKNEFYLNEDLDNKLFNLSVQNKYLNSVKKDF